MSRGSAGRTQKCSEQDARTRLRHALRRLLNLKDEAHYGLFDVSGQDLKTALRQAEGMVKFAEKVLNR
jgi:hypothetical protein